MSLSHPLDPKAVEAANKQLWAENKMPHRQLTMEATPLETDYRQQWIKNYKAALALAKQSPPPPLSPPQSTAPVATPSLPCPAASGTDVVDVTPNRFNRIIAIEAKETTRSPFKKYPLRRTIEIGYRLIYDDRTGTPQRFSTDIKGNGRTSYEISEKEFAKLRSIELWGEPYGYSALLSPGADRATGRIACVMGNQKSTCTFEVLESVVQFIVDEMNKNKHQVDIIRQNNSASQRARQMGDEAEAERFKHIANNAWGAKVHTNSGLKGVMADLYFLGGGEWDHKPVIGPVWGEWNRLGDSKKTYYYDIWSNIHYAYVGRAAGFTLHELHLGASKQQQADSGTSDEKTDMDSITEGFNLYRSDADVSVEDVLGVLGRHDEWLKEAREKVWAKQREEQQRKQEERQVEKFIRDSRQPDPGKI